MSDKSGGEGPSVSRNPVENPEKSGGETSASSTDSVKSQPELGGLDAAGDGDGDGFKTPDQKIPAVTDCPPAPKKPRPPSPVIGKRKAASPRRCRMFRADVSTSQLESAFPPAQVRREERDDDGDDDASSRNAKRAREK